MPTDQRINYLELPARDLDAAQEFYEGAFGWSFVDYGPEYRSFSDGAAQLISPGERPTGERTGARRQ